MSLTLQVPFHEKDEAKRLGARWEPVLRAWYIPAGFVEEPFSKWIRPMNDHARSLIPTLNGRVEHGTGDLFVDMIPQSAWFSNLRSELTHCEWEQAKTKTFRAARYRCQVCAGVGDQWPVECHERFDYTEDGAGGGVQTLSELIALCPACHEVTHFGLARVRGRDKDAIQHMMYVTGWSESEVVTHIHQATTKSRRLSLLKWRLDARWLIGYVELTNLTRQKITDHFEGIADRSVSAWQASLIKNG